MVNRVVFSLASVVSLYLATIGLARLSYARRGLCGISIDITDLNSGVSRIRYLTLPVSEIAGVSTTDGHIIVLTEAGRRIQVPMKALDTDLSAVELPDSIRSVLPNTTR